MKELKSAIMQKFLKQGLRKAKKMTPPSDGSMFGLIQKNIGKDRYQVEFIHDTRIHPKPYVIVYLFKKGAETMAAVSADHYLSKEISWVDIDKLELPTRNQIAVLSNAELKKLWRWLGKSADLVTFATKEIQKRNLKV